MTKKEFYLIALIVIFTYLAIIFQINYKNFIVAEKDGNSENMEFNAFRFN